MSGLMLAAFFMYVCILSYIAYRVSQYNVGLHKDSSFILSGRTLNYWVTALSAHAADMSDWLFMGLPGAIYVFGGIKIWVAVALVIGMFLCWQFIARPLRIQTERRNSYTLTSFLQRRFNDTTGLINIICAVVVIFFFTIYLAVGIKGAGYILNIAFGIPYLVGALIGTAVVIVYTIVGGYLTVAWIDAFQALFLLAAIICTPLIAFFSSNGLAGIIQGAAQKNVDLSLVPHSWHEALQILLDPFGWALGYFGMPHILSKFMGAQNPDELKKAKYIGLIWQICALGAAVSVALVGFSYFGAGLMTPELIFIKMTTELFNPFFAGLILCGILAATFSTMDSQLLVLAGIITDDIYSYFFKSNNSPNRSRLIYGTTIVIAPLVAFGIATNEASTIFGLVEYAWSGIGASFGPIVILALYSKYITNYGALSGIISGGMTAGLWKHYEFMPFGLTINAIIPGFIINFIAAYTVSFIGKKIFR